MRYLLLMFFVFNSYNILGQSLNNYYNEAMDFQNKKEYSKAIEKYNDHLNYSLTDTMYEDISLTYWNLQYCYSQLKDYANAISACNNWINKGWYWKGNAYYNLAINYYSIGEYSSAIFSYGKTIQFSFDYKKGSSIKITDIYSYIKSCYSKIGNSYGWIPESEFYNISIPHGYWHSTNQGKNSNMYDFAVRIENRLPISIQAVNIDLIIKDKKGTIVYKKNHTAWVRDLGQNEVMQSEYFDLDNQVMLPTSYLNSEKFNWSCIITGVAY